MDIVRAFGIGFAGAAGVHLEIVDAPCAIFVHCGTFVRGECPVLGPFQPALGCVVGPDALVGQGGGPGLDPEHGDHECSQHAQDDNNKNGLDQGEAAMLVSVSHKSREVEHVHLVQKGDLLPFFLQGEFQGHQCGAGRGPGFIGEIGALDMPCH